MALLDQGGRPAPGGAGRQLTALGLDVGLSGTRAAVVAEDGTVLGTAATRRRHGLTVSDGIAEQDATVWIDEIIETARLALAAARTTSVAVIGVGALGSAPILVDRDLQPVGPALLLALDRRSEQVRHRLIEETGADAIDVPTDHAVPKLVWWQQERPDVFARAAWAVDATGYIVGWLTGVPTIDTITAADYSLAGFAAPLPVPAPFDPLAIVGGLRLAAADALGIPSGTPVIAGTYDSYVDLFGVGLDTIGEGGIILGSTAVVAVTCNSAESGARHGLRPTSLPGGVDLIGGWTSSAGATLEWFAKTLASGVDRERLTQAAALLPPGAGGLLALPYLEGERSPLWDSNARGAILGLTKSTTADEIYRALVDGVALSIRHITSKIAQDLELPATWRVAGGGIRHEAWLQATADALDAPLTVFASAGGVAGAKLALQGLGVHVPHGRGRIVAPMSEAARTYDRLFALYTDLHPTLKHVMRELSIIDNTRVPHE